MKEPEKCRCINGTANFSQADYLLCKSISFLLIMKYYVDSTMLIMFFSLPDELEEKIY